MNRLDKELLLRGLVLTRTKAQELIASNVVFVNGKIANKASSPVEECDKIEIAQNDILKYVSRGGLKLEKALRAFNYNVNGKVVMDIGSSTGGFTDCCLKHGAKKVVAIDVGTNVMDQSLRTNPAVELYENTNIKDVSEEIFNNVDLIVVDVSFISLEKIIEKVSTINKKLDMICLIKPQFECGKDIAKKYHGIIKNKNIHFDIINNVIKYFNKYAYWVINLDVSPIAGGDGNIEYLALFTNKQDKNANVNINKIVCQAF